MFQSGCNIFCKISHLFTNALVAMNKLFYILDNLINLCINVNNIFFCVGGSHSPTGMKGYMNAFAIWSMYIPCSVLLPVICTKPTIYHQYPT